MQIERFRDRFRDVIGLIVTPMDSRYAVDEGALRAQIDWCIAQGATGIVATGSIGEFLHLEDAERLRVLEVVLDQTRKHPGASAFAMTSGATTLQAMRWTRTAAELGYDCAVVIAPYYWKVGEREAFEHFRTIAEAELLPVCVYHNPALSKFHMSPAFFAKVAQLENVACVKEVETDLQHLEQVADALAGRAIYLKPSARTSRDGCSARAAAISTSSRSRPAWRSTTRGNAATSRWRKRSSAA